MRIDIGEILYVHREPQTTRRNGNDTMISSARSAEQWLDEVNQIVRTYRSTDPKLSIEGARQAAIKQLRDLGLTEGDALRYLGKPYGPEKPTQKPRR